MHVIVRDWQEVRREKLVCEASHDLAGVIVMIRGFISRWQQSVVSNTLMQTDAVLRIRSMGDSLGVRDSIGLSEGMAMRDRCMHVGYSVHASTASTA